MVETNNNRGSRASNATNSVDNTANGAVSGAATEAVKGTTGSSVKSETMEVAKGAAMDTTTEPGKGMTTETVKATTKGETGSAVKSEAAIVDRYGRLPQNGLMAVAYVPFQPNNSAKYEPATGLSKGTLFPALDMPWKNISNQTNPYADTPLGELMSLGFALNELGLYLDTHEDDKDALELFSQYNSLMREGYEKYVKLYGPIKQTDVTAGGWTWVNDPWPWEYSQEKRGGK